MSKSLPHPRGQQYAVSANTKGVEKSGFVNLTVVTLGQDVLAMDETTRVDLADHPLYKELQTYVLNNPR